MASYLNSYGIILESDLTVMSPDSPVSFFYQKVRHDFEIGDMSVLQKKTYDHTILCTYFNSFFISNVSF